MSTEMTMINTDGAGFAGGVDTHKHVHVAAVVDPVGREIATSSFGTDQGGLSELAAWLTGHEVGLVGVEGTGSWGAGAARTLRAAGLDVVEINRPNRQERRRQGKSDTLDAVAAARAAVAGRHAGEPKARDGRVESIRLLRLARRSAVRDRTSVMNQIRSVIDTAPAGLRDTLIGLSKSELIDTTTRFRPNPAEVGDPLVAAKYTLRALGRRWQQLNTEIGELDRVLDQLVADTAPRLIGSYCVGTDTAASLLIAAGDNPDRLRNEAAFAALCGTNPLPATSGRVQNRHRLNRSGDRDANHALWRIALARMSHDPRTRAYVQRRVAEGRTKLEIIRCLKRYIARELFPLLRDDLNDLGVV